VLAGLGVLELEGREIGVRGHDQFLGRRGGRAQGQDQGGEKQDAFHGASLSEEWETVVMAEMARNRSWHGAKPWKMQDGWRNSKASFRLKERVCL
jgi:sensor domain CHASE-containing protein